MLVMVEDYVAEDVLHRDDRVPEIAVVPRMGRLPLALHGETIDIFPGVAIDRRNKVCAYTLRSIMVGVGDAGIGTPGSGVIAHDRPAHRFNTAPDARLDHSGMYLRSNQAHSIQA